MHSMKIYACRSKRISAVLNDQSLLTVLYPEIRPFYETKKKLMEFNAKLHIH